MEVLVAGGHGQVARRLLRALAEQGHRGRGLIRNPDQAADLEADGAEAVVLDLEQDAIEDDLSDVVSSADAVVFAAGAGPGSGAERKQTMDFGGAVKLMDAAKAAGVRRYVIVSSMGADDPESASGPMGPYLEAKAAADRALEASGLDYTIVRPGGLTNDPGTGRIEAATKLGRRGQVPRDDVAQTLLATLFAPTTIGKTFEVLSGDTPIQEAVRSV
ncbi:MAG TPA: SDR family oxidoreductase [Thermoleophilaceae bacterium]